MRGTMRVLLMIIVIFFFLIEGVFCQSVDTLKETLLPSIIIKAFETQKKLKDVPAAVAYINKATLSGFSPVSIVSAMNSMPGVKMEERSPGSYRLNIRGSSLRSPFGVRNVKIYYNDIPFTDPGGNSYLNQLGYYLFNNIEIIKGANNSIYGAGTGGAMLIESLNENEKSNVFSEYSTGSYNMQNIYGSLTQSSNKSVNKYGYQHQQSDGYREHSALKRNVYNWNGIYGLYKNRSLKTTFLYGDLFYQTPGALTVKEYEQTPTKSRPSVGTVPSAILANTSIHEQLFLAGATYTQQILPNVSNRTNLYGYFAELRNPSIASYGKSSEPNFGGRTEFNFNKKFSRSELRTVIGFEYQRGYISVSTSINKNGNADTLKVQDEINNQQNFLFAQASLDIASFSIIAGASFNTSSINFERFSSGSLGKLSRKFNNQIAPRVAIMKKFGDVNFYTSISRGFSPPTTAELVPTGGAINLGLSPEKALNYELGIKTFLTKNLYLDVNAFILKLDNTIVQRHNANAGDYYDNAGDTRQKGIEGYANYQLFIHSKKIRKFSTSISYTGYDFKYNNFKQQSTDYSGNQLPSVPKNTINLSTDLSLLGGLYFNANYYYSDRIAVNDANTQYASSYNLLGGKIGFEKIYKQSKTKIAFGADNLFNQRYSLGNDINGFGGRYYNAAAGRNYYVSLSLQLPTHKKTQDD